ncbi:MAG: signal peptidase II [candidate division WOR-3 bacterium]|nr:signal peptidase II [candidate division WOR-3 bacterium]MCX7948081.1 signal peptidase II [candidate division WOR-3 bacterium]MDW8150981.1 signal peptidase II [candidate division WOR-3 bacterium]
MRGKILYLVFIPLVVLLIDQISKFLVENYLPLYQPVEIINGYLRFTFVYNPGIAFGLHFGEGFPYLFLAIIITIFVIYLAIREKSNLSFFAYTLIIGGALGNIFDRVFRGMVVDFIDIGINENLRWFIFNLADSFITIAIALLLFDSFFRKKNEAKR